MDLLYNTFQSGELSPKMKGRSDLPQYHQGCETVENFVVEPTGGATRRPGFEHIDAPYSHSYASRLIGFVQGADRYVLEFSNLMMRVFHDGDIVCSTGTTPYTLTTPWTAAEVPDLVFAPGGKAIFHPDHDPYELVCSGDASWTLTAFASVFGPFLKQNTTLTKTITPSGTTGNITLTASGHTPFVAGSTGHVGALWQLSHQVAESTVNGTFSATGTSSVLLVGSKGKVFLYGGFQGTLKFQRSVDYGTLGVGATWTDVRVWDHPAVIGLAIEEPVEEYDDNVYYRLDMTLTTGSMNYQIRALSFYQKGIVRITAVTSTSLASATVLTALGGTGATYRWSEGAWSPYQGYPACGTIHESRLYAAATTRKPTGVWAGKTFLRREDVRLFDAGNTYEADDAISRILDVQDCNAIQWLASLWVMLVGSDGNLTKIVGPSENAPATGKDFIAMPQSGMGSSSLQPVRIAGFLAYTGRDGKRVYEMTYSDDARVYQPEDLTFFAEHIAGDGIAEWAFQQQPVPILWAVTDGGELIGLTRDREKGVMGWHRHPMPGATVESVCVVPGDTADEVWISVARTINGSTYRSIEKMAPFDWGDSQRDCFFVDSGTKWDGGAAVDITGISVSSSTNRVTVTASGMTDDWTVRLAGVVGTTDVNGKVYTVADATATTFVLKTRDGTAYIDGSAFGGYNSGGTVERVTNTVTGLTHIAGEKNCAVLLDGQPGTGNVTTAGVYTVGTKDRHYFNTIIIGLASTYTLKPMPPEVRTVNGSLQGIQKRITRIGVRVYQSAGGQVGSSADDAQNIDYRIPGHITGTDMVVADGDWQQDYPGGWNEDGAIVVTGNGPLPMTVTAILFGME